MALTAVIMLATWLITFLSMVTGALVCDADGAACRRMQQHGDLISGFYFVCLVLGTAQYVVARAARRHRTVVVWRALGAAALLAEVLALRLYGR